VPLQSSGLSIGVVLLPGAHAQVFSGPGGDARLQFWYAFSRGSEAVRLDYRPGRCDLAAVADPGWARPVGDLQE
jgi:hypothetical protein